MSLQFTLAQIEQLKLRAKFVSRSSSISHSVALDQLAHENGFSNWSLLMKHAVVQQDLELSSKYMKFNRTQQEMRDALRTIRETRYNFNSRVEDAERQTTDICRDFASARNAVDFAIGYTECLLTVPRFKIDRASKVYWEMRSWLPYEVSENGEDTQILVNRHYKPVGKTGNDWSNYEEFLHLKTHLQSTELEAIAHRPASSGYLYNDGCTPWSSRKDAKHYLERLKKLQNFLR
jgi:hypothetical protein